MSPTALDITLLAILLVSITATVFAWFLRNRLRNMAVEQPTVIRQHVEAGIRQEVDRLRTDSSDQARALRLEVGENVRGFQGTVLQAFTSLGEQQTEQMRSFGDDLGSGFV